MSRSGAFIHIKALRSISTVPDRAVTEVRSVSSLTVSILIARVPVQDAFVDVGAVFSVSGETDMTFTGEGAESIGASRVIMAVVSTLALVNV